VQSVTLLHPFSSSTTPDFFAATVPIDLSGRTSYLQARLAYYPYPQVIPAYCIRHGFGPPPDLRRGSPCSWIALLVSGLPRFPWALFRPTLTGFAFATLASIVGLKLWKERQLAGSFFNRHEITPINRSSLGLSADSFRFYFTGRPALLFTFPLRN
jgi:hypothetical protein